MPHDRIASDKQTCRKLVKESIAAMDDATRGELSVAACARVATLPAFEKATTLLAYKPIRGECSPNALVALAHEQGKRVVFPLCLAEHQLALYVADSEEDFTIGAYGIPEPDTERCRCIAADEVDFAIIPGVAFDVSCNRLGRGAGYYDRFLSGFRGVKAGLAYSCQIFASVPADEHDIRMDYVVTNNGIIVNNRQ